MLERAEGRVDGEDLKAALSDMIARSDGSSDSTHAIPRAPTSVGARRPHRPL